MRIHQVQNIITWAVLAGDLMGWTRLVEVS
jgi:hypothetical protein